MSASNITLSKKRKFGKSEMKSPDIEKSHETDCLSLPFTASVADGVFLAELTEFLSRTLSEEGFAGCEVRNTHSRTEIIIRASRTAEGKCEICKRLGR